MLVLCHEDESQLALVAGQNTPKHPHIEEVQTLGFGLDLFRRGKVSFNVVNRGATEPDLLVFRHPHRVTALELNQPQFVQIEVESRVVREILWRELELNLTAITRALGVVEGNGEGEGGEGETGEYRPHCCRG